MYLSVVLLLDVREECGVAEVGFSAGTLEIPGFDADGEFFFGCGEGLHIINLRAR